MDKTLDLYRRDFDGNWFPDDLYFEQLVGNRKKEKQQQHPQAELRGVHGQQSLPRSMRGMRRAKRIRRGV